MAHHDHTVVHVSFPELLHPGKGLLPCPEVQQHRVAPFGSNHDAAQVGNPDRFASGDLRPQGKGQRRLAGDDDDAHVDLSGR